MTKEQILNLPNMSEEEQCLQLAKHFEEQYYETEDWPFWWGVCDTLLHETSLGRGMELEHLAFRLRDEVNKTDQTHRAFIDALYTIQEHLDKTDWATSYWGLNLCGPIHWICATLLAGLENDK